MGITDKNTIPKIPKVTQSTGDDYGDAGLIACNIFMQHLEKFDTNTVLIFQLH